MTTIYNQNGTQVNLPLNTKTTIKSRAKFWLISTLLKYIIKYSPLGKE